MNSSPLPETGMSMMPQGVPAGMPEMSMPQPGPGMAPMPQPPFPEAGEPEYPQEDEAEQGEEFNLDSLLEQTNIAEHLKEDTLNEIGEAVWDGYKLDLESKTNWDRQVDEWVKLASQIKEDKTFPWPKAANVKYPLLATAAMQFAARAYPSLVPADGKVVQMKVVGLDPTGQKAIKADKLAKHMNYQLLQDMEDWEEEMDRLLIMLPVIGCLFKKTYFDPIRQTNASKLIGPKDLVVNYWASSLGTAHRVSEIILMTKNQIQVQKNAKLYLDVDLGEPLITPEIPGKSDVHGTNAPSKVDHTTPYVIIEQHTYWDIDEDGYAEPYIITIDLNTKKVLRIVARWDSDGTVIGDAGKLICITPVQYYTKYSFIPNPDGGFYDIGFGHLLGPLNDSANTVINQLIDAGTLANMQAGFIGKGLRIKLGETKFTPGEWKAVNATGDDIKKQIFPLPTQQPSDVLFKLLGMLIESGKELASVAEIFTGKMPGQNTPATTTQASIEQGMKVFTAIYKRTYRSQEKEFKKLFRLNSIYEENFAKAKLVLDEPIAKEDYDRHNYDVCPTADPTAVSTTQKQLKVQGLLDMLPLGTLNSMEVTKRMLEAQEQPNIGALMQQPQPQPDPKMMAAQAKIQGDQQKAQMDQQAQAQKMQLEKEKAQLDLMQKQLEMQMEMKKRAFDQKMDALDRQMDMQLKQMEAALEARKAQQVHTQEMAQAGEEHQVNLQRIKDESAAKQRAVSRVAGKPSNSGKK